MPVVRILSVVLAVFVLSVSWLATSPAADWPTFRGTDRMAVSPDTGLLSEWPSGGPPLLWKAEGTGRGYSSLAIANGRIYTLGDSIAAAEGDKDEYLMCLDGRDGSLVWKTRTGPPWMDRQPSWGSPRSTPTVDGDR